MTLQQDLRLQQTRDPEEVESILTRLLILKLAGLTDIEAAKNPPMINGKFLRMN